MKLEPGTIIPIPAEIQKEITEFHKLKEREIVAENKAERNKRILKMRICNLLEEVIPEIADESYKWNTETMEVVIKGLKGFSSPSMTEMMQKIAGGK